MIINTIILFLRDLLPIFILLSYLHVLLKNQTLPFTYLSPSILLGVVGSILFFLIAPYISEYFEGTGMERVLASLLLITYGSLCFISPFTSKQRLSLLPIKITFLLGVTAFVIFKVSTFLIFFNSYFQQQGNAINSLIGCIVGLGICASFSALFTFILTEIIERNKSTVINICWALFLAGQVSQITIYLSQVDLINVGPPILNLSGIVQDSSEYGHVLKALIGYEESPSLVFIILYGFAFSLPFLTRSFIAKYYGYIHREEHDDK